MPREAVIRVENARVTKAGRTILSVGCLEVSRGERVAVIGESGSGKTTLMRMLKGYAPCEEGRVVVLGDALPIRERRRMKAHHRRIGMIHQHFDLIGRETVWRNVWHGRLGCVSLLGSALGVRSARDLAVCGRAIREVRLDDKRLRSARTLSGGEQQRVAIARALVFEPRLVLMDEPLGALDRRLREEMQYEIRRIQRELEVTVVYVTHDQTEAMAMSDRVAVFNRGRIEQIAPPEALYEEPEREFVAGFIGENNLLPGRVTSVDGDLCMVDFGGLAVQAFAVATRAVGEDVILAIRPERVALTPRPGEYTNEFDAKVEDLVFLGDHLRVRLSLGGRDDFVAKIPNIVGHGAVLKGDRVRIGWTPTDCRALAAEDAHMDAETA